MSLQCQEQGFVHYSGSERGSHQSVTLPVRQTSCDPIADNLSSFDLRYQQHNQLCLITAQFRETSLRVCKLMLRYMC